MTLSFLTESKASHVGITSMRRVVITLLVMLLTSASALAQTYWLTLDPNYEGAMGNRIPVSSFKPTYTLTSNVEPTREGYTFYGWSTTPTGLAEFNTNDKITLTGDLTLYAVWDCPYVVGDVKTIGSLKYQITNANPKQVELYGYEGEKPTGTLNIPATITIDDKEFSVTSIHNSAFVQCVDLTSVTIPTSVTSIGHFAFSDCSNLTSITINGNPFIGICAFENTPANVTMNLTASKIDGDYWTTFYNEFYNFQADGKTTVYKGMVNESSLMLTEVSDRIVNKKTAVILKSSGNPVMTLTETYSSDTNSNSLRGISDRKKKLAEVMSANNANTIYTLGNTSAGFGFHKYTGEYVPFNKAFLPLNTSNGAKPILNMVFANETTGINSLSSDDNALQNDWFSLDGTRLNGKPTQRGIYINGNKKVVVK